MHLHRRRICRLAEDRSPLGEKGVAAGSETLQLCAIEFRTRAQTHLSLQHGEVLVNRVSVRWDEAATQLADAHHEFLSHLFDVAVDDGKIFVERREWNILDVLGIAAPSGESPGPKKNEESCKQALWQVHRETSDLFSSSAKWSPQMVGQECVPWPRVWSVMGSSTYFPFFTR